MDNYKRGYLWTQAYHTDDIQKGFKVTVECGIIGSLGQGNSSISMLASCFIDNIILYVLDRTLSQ